jgi:cysteine desulfurase family protein
MAYFDNAATTYPKPECVYTFMDEFYHHNGGNAGRGQYAIAQSAKGLIDDTRKRLQNLLHCPAKQVIFEPTATIALNIIIQGIIAQGAKNIFISPFEHNAVTRTLHHFEQSGLIKVYQLTVSENLSYDLQRIRYQFDAVSPNVVIVSHASNVTGLIAPVTDIFTIAKGYGATTLVDMAQTAGLVDCDIGLDIFDFAIFAGHKTLLGPTGISGFVMKPDIVLPSVIFGGTGYESANQDMPMSLPERYEMGTLNIAGVAGLNAALKWIDEKTVDYLRRIENEKRAILISLLNKYDFLSLIGNVEGRNYVGIVSCLFDDISSDSAGEIFSSRGVSVRTGLHCAPLAHKFLGTFPAGTVRFSVNSFTSDEDFEQLSNVLDSISEELLFGKW